MTSNCSDRQRYFSYLIGLLFFGGACLSDATAGAQTRQGGPELKTRTGTLVEVAQKGRVQVLKYTDDAGEAQELIVTPKIRAEVQAAGDAGFLQPGRFVAALATESNKMLFTKEVSVHLFGKGRPPGGKIVKAPLTSGQSKNAYQVTGTINAAGPDPDYPDYHRVDVKAAGPRAPLMLEKGFTVTVKSSDLSLAPPGTPVELSGTELRNGRFNAVKVSLKLADPLNAEEVLGSSEKKAEK